MRRLFNTHTIELMDIGELETILYKKLSEGLNDFHRFKKEDLREIQSLFLNLIEVKITKEIS